MPHFGQHNEVAYTRTLRNQQKYIHATPDARWFYLNQFNESSSQMQAARTADRQKKVTSRMDFWLMMLANRAKNTQNSKLRAGNSEYKVQNPPLEGQTQQQSQTAIRETETQIKLKSFSFNYDFLCAPLQFQHTKHKLHSKCIKSNLHEKFT